MLPIDDLAALQVPLQVSYRLLEIPLHSSSENLLLQEVRRHRL